MSGIEAAGLALGMISAIISIIDATSKVYEAVKDEAGLPPNFKKSATKLPLISKLLEDAERYVKGADKATETAFTPTLEDCKAQATQLQELFAKVMPEEGGSRWDRYVKAVRTIGKGGRLEDLIRGILDGLQLLATRFPEVTTERTKGQLATAVEEVTKMEPSLPDGFEEMSTFANYGTGAQNNNTGSGTQHNNSGTGHQNSGSGIMVIGNNYNVQYHAPPAIDGASSHGNVFFKVPRPANFLFTGRVELLVRIKAILHSDITAPNKQQRRFVITGLGGQGKSEICLQVANLLKDEYTHYEQLSISANGHSFWGIFWVDVDKSSTAERDFTAVAELLGHPLKTVPETLQVLATTHKSWLLILDNADDPEFDYQVYFPPGNHGAVLMTSRVTECRQYSPDAFEALEGLGEDDSKALLLKAAGLLPESWPSYDAPAREIVNLLGSHTLALIHAGAYVSQGHCQLYEYPKVYRWQRKRLMKYRPNQAKSRYCDVYATFEASADILKKSQNESAGDALQLLGILSMLDSSVLPLQIFEEAWKTCKELLQANNIKDRIINKFKKLLQANHIKDRIIDEFSLDHVPQLPSFMVLEDDVWNSFRLTEACSLLVSLSMITRHDLDDYLGLSMHPLTHAWAKDRQDSERQGMAWIAAGCVLGFSCSNVRMWEEQQRLLLPHILSYLDIEVKRASGFASKAVVTPIILECGWALLKMRQDSRLDRLIQDTFFELGQNPTESSKEFLSLYELYASHLLNLGRNKDAMALLEQLRKIQEKVLGKRHPETLAIVSHLAVVLSRQGKYADAEAMNRQTLEIREEVLGKRDRETLITMSNLALVLTKQGKHADAEAMNRQTLEIKEEVLGKRHPDTLMTMNNLVLVLSKQGKYADAEAMSRQTLEIREEVLGKTHIDTLMSVYNLAYVLHNKQEYEEASLLYERAYTGYKLLLGPEHRTTRSCQMYYSATLNSLEEAR